MLFVLFLTKTGKSAEGISKPRNFYVWAQASFIATKLPDHEVVLCSSNTNFLRECQSSETAAAALLSVGIEKLVAVKNPADVLNKLYRGLDTQCKCPLTLCYFNISSHSPSQLLVYAVEEQAIVNARAVSGACHVSKRLYAQVAKDMATQVNNAPQVIINPLLASWYGASF